MLFARQNELRGKMINKEEKQTICANAHHVIDLRAKITGDEYYASVDSF